MTDDTGTDVFEYTPEMMANLKAMAEAASAFERADAELGGLEVLAEQDRLWRLVVQSATT